MNRPFQFFSSTMAAAWVFSFASTLAAQVPVDATPAGVNFRADLPYDTHARQKLDLYLPIGRPKEPRPVIIVVHDGGGHSGSKSDNRALALRFVAQGYAVVCIDYRFSSDAEFPAQIEDCKSTVRWVRSAADRLKLDRDHIGIIGFGSGGHLAALTGAMNSNRLYESGGSLDQHSRVQGVVDLAGPTDLLKLYDDAMKTGGPQAAEVAALMGGDPHLMNVPTAASNPTQFADAQSPPFLIIHGDQDNVVPLEHSRLLYDALVAKTIPAHLHIIRGAGHGGPAFSAPDINEVIDEFFRRTLKRGTEPPRLEPVILTESQAAVN